MSPNIIKYLEDIKLSIVSIEKFVTGISASYKYQRDDKTKSAVERKLTIIGEALNKINK